jgi:carbonic anhydrase/acetyltransferase-like protein (isoleucine patch superfamily)
MTRDEARIDETAVVVAGAIVRGRVTVGPRALILFGTVIRAEYDVIEIGAETNVQDNSVLHCDDGLPCLVGDRVTIGHSAVVHGARVGDRALVGIGAIMLNGSSLGEGAWLGSGSLLTPGREIPPWTLGIGSPARPIRDLTEDEIARADDGVNHYLDLLDRYRE